VSHVSRTPPLTPNVALLPSTQSLLQKYEKTGMVLFNLEEEQIKEIFDKYGEHPKECAFVPHT
jgi:hypothetical protein